MEEERDLPKEAYESLPEEEKDNLNKFQKKGVITTKARHDAKTGEKLSEETEYNSEYRRKKGTFHIGSPEKLIKVCLQSKTRAINKMLVYIILNANYKNEFVFDKTFIESYGEKNKTRFFSDRRYLLDNKYIFKKPFKKNVFTVDVELICRGGAYIAAQLYQEQYGEELNEDSKLEFNKLIKRIPKLSKTDLEKLLEHIQKQMKTLDETTKETDEEEIETTNEEEQEETEKERLERQREENIKIKNSASSQLELQRAETNIRNINRRLKQIEKEEEN